MTQKTQHSRVPGSYGVSQQPSSITQGTQHLHAHPPPSYDVSQQPSSMTQNTQHSQYSYTPTSIKEASQGVRSGLFGSSNPLRASGGPCSGSSLPVRGSSGPPPSCGVSQQQSSTGRGTEQLGNPLRSHNWQEAVLDTATMPPPPVIGNYCSSTENASRDDADRAHAWCERNPLWKPRFSPEPVCPRGFSGEVTFEKGRWKGSSAVTCGECVILTHSPLYLCNSLQPVFPAVQEFTKERVYFEVTLRGLRVGPTTGPVDFPGFAIGFVTKHYPSWRFPGWERGSVGVFSDDGCSFVWGGKEFTTPIKVGETVGLGMKFSPFLGRPCKVCKVNVSSLGTDKSGRSGIARGDRRGRWGRDGVGR